MRTSFFFGQPPWCVDILTSMSGIQASDAYVDRVRLLFAGQELNFISLEWLINAKRARSDAKTSWMPKRSNA